MYAGSIIYCTWLQYDISVGFYVYIINNSRDCSRSHHCMETFYDTFFVWNNLSLKISAEKILRFCSTSEDLVVLYSCNHGYSLNGSAEIICSGNGWSTQPPQCRARWPPVIIWFSLVRMHLRWASHSTHNIINHTKSLSIWFKIENMKNSMQTNAWWVISEQLDHAMKSVFHTISNIPWWNHGWYQLKI